MTRFVPDTPPVGMPQEHAEWIMRQLRRITGSVQISDEGIDDNTGRIELLEQHPPRTDNPHQTSWTNLLNKPSCPVNWAGHWDANQAAGYQACDMVFDDGWTMIANKATTERPAPQAQGSPFWVSDLPGSPSWGLQSATSSSLIVGQRYTWDVDGYLRTVRMDRAVASPTIQHELWFVGDPLGAPDSRKIIGPVVPDATGWLSFPQGEIFVLAGQAFDVFLLTRALDTPTSFSGTWDYKRSNGDPSEKEINHQSAGGGNEMRIHHTDEDEMDRSLELESLQVGDEISGGGITWIITSTDHHLDHVRFGVTPSTRAQEGKYSFQFTTYSPQPISYNRADDHFLSESRVQGFYSESGYSNIVLDDHAYGVDIEVQLAAISPDWDLVANSN